jgi:hypothetical protein
MGWASSDRTIGKAMSPVAPFEGYYNCYTERKDFAKNQDDVKVGRPLRLPAPLCPAGHLPSRGEIEMPHRRAK